MTTEQQITQHDEDILPDLTELTDDLHLFEEEPPMTETIATATAKLVSHGCVGLGKGLEACVDIYEGAAEFYINILGQKVAARTIDSNGTTCSYGANVGFAKVSGSYSVNWGSKTASIEGSACYWKLVKWVCSSYKKTILKW